jgi:hypothetical protein
MTDQPHSFDDATMKLGLLMESAQAHQKMAESHLEQLRTHTRGLDEVVRDEIRRTLIEELAGLTAEAARAAESLERIRRAWNLRGLLWGVGTAVLATAIPGAFLHWTLPSEAEITALRLRRDQLQASVKGLEQMGGRAEWRRCGDGNRICVRVDKSAPSYGEKGDYLIVKGY